MQHSSTAAIDVLLSKVIEDKVEISVDVVGAGNGIQSSDMEHISIGPGCRIQEIVGGDLLRLELSKQGFTMLALCRLCPSSHHSQTD